MQGIFPAQITSPRIKSSFNQKTSCLPAGSHNLIFKARHSILVLNLIASHPNPIASLCLTPWHPHLQLHDIPFLNPTAPLFPTLLHPHVQLYCIPVCSFILWFFSFNPNFSKTCSDWRVILNQDFWSCLSHSLVFMTSPEIRLCST